MSSRPQAPGAVLDSSAPVVVTGGCGFVGATLCATLVRAGMTVIAVDDQRVGSPQNWPLDVANEIELARFDIRDSTQISRLLTTRRPGAVFHLAAVHFIPACEANPPEAVSVNTVGSQVLLTACERAFSPPVLVMASTAAVYAPSTRAHREGEPVGPIDIYGLSKAWMEQAAELHHRRTGAAVALARLFNVIGQGETNPHLLPEIIRQARTSSTLSLGNLATQRDYIHVLDAADGLIALARTASRNAEPMIANLGTGRAIDGHALVREVGEVLGCELRVEVDSSRLRASDRPVLISDCTYGAEQLGWGAQRSLTEAVRAAVEHDAASLAGAPRAAA